MKMEKFYCKWCGAEVEEGQGYCDSDCYAFVQQAEKEAEIERQKNEKRSENIWPK